MSKIFIWIEYPYDKIINFTFENNNVNIFEFSKIPEKPSILSTDSSDGLFFINLFIPKQRIETALEQCD